ncbi:MAG: DnaJ domain-containing protein, partial [Bacillota bacterium]
MAKRDFYEVMGISKGADEAEIKKAYRRLARELHPDANPDDPQATERFKEVKEAYDVLSDPQKRAQYDQFGHAAFDQQAGFGGAQQGGFGDFGASPFGDIFESFFGGMAGGRRHTGPERGADLRYDLDITFEEAYFGVEKEIDIARIESCPTCGGSGAKPGTQTSTCKVCNGTGQVQTTQRTPLGNFVSVRPCEHCHGTGK